MQRKKFFPVCMYSVAMAFLESAVVVYLRRIFNINDLILDIHPYDPLLATIEIGREFATLIMLFSVGWAVGKTLQSRIGFSVIIFGVWDIFYYLWLKLFINWPESLLSHDILFLIPLPWWGPVIAPLIIASLMVIWGVFAIYAEDKGNLFQFSVINVITLIIGVLLLLYSFMKDALSLIPTDAVTLSKMRPSGFNWPSYLIGLIILVYGVFQPIWSQYKKMK